METSGTMKLSDQTFDDEVLKASLPVLVDFWAPWCAPCRAVAPVVEALASDLAGRMKVGKLNIDENPAVTRRFGILSIPTLLVFKDGKVVETLVGAAPKAKLRAALDRHAAARAAAAG